MSIVVQSTLVLATGAAAAIAAVPAINRVLLGDIRQDWLCDEIEFDHIQDDGITVAMKSGRFCRIVRLVGVSYDAMVAEELLALSDARAKAFAGLAAAGINFRLFAVKRRAAMLYRGDWPAGGIAEIGTAEEKRFEQTFEVGWFVVMDARNLEQLDKESRRFLSFMKTHEASFVEGATPGADESGGPADMSNSAQDASAHRAGMNCGLASFVNYLMTGDLSHHLHGESSNLSQILGHSNLDIEDNGDIWTTTPERKLQRIVAVRRWPEIVSGKLIGELLRLPVELEISQTAIPEGKTKAQVMFDRKAAETSRLVMFGGASRAQDFQAAVEVLGKEGVELLQTEFQVCIRASDRDEMARAETMVMDVLGRHKVSANMESAAAPILWFNRMPGPRHRSGRTLRPLRLMTTNLSAIWSFSNMTAGSTRSPWGPQPVRLFTGESGQSYAFQFHASAEPQSVGHYLVLAPTGGGKTTLMMHLLSGLAKFKRVRSYVFDSREGARFTIEALGGHYQSFENLHLNPLDVEDSPNARHRINLIVRSMLASHGHDDDVNEIVDQILSATFQAQRKHRTFNHIFPLAFKAGSASRQAFLPWVTDKKGNSGMYAHVFNAPRDSLNDSLAKSWLTGINMNQALSDPVLGPPIVTHIMNMISDTATGLASAGGGGFNIFIDEAANLLTNAGFRKAVVEMYREYRKLNGVVGMAFQDPAALHASGIADAVIDNTCTLIIFPNTQARADDYAPFNLNAEQLAFITGNHDGRKVLLVRRDGPSGLDETVVLDADLGWLGDSMRFFKSGPEAVNRLVRLQKESPAGWEALI